MTRKILIMTAAFIICSAANAQRIEYTTDSQTGRVTSIGISHDKQQSNWILCTDGTQYPWVTEKYSWGNGRMKIDGNEYFWQLDNGKAQCGDIMVSVKRKRIGNDISETYTWLNTGDKPIRLSEVGIFTPINDNYPKSDTCVTKRCNAHFWTGGNTAYICALRMNGEAPHLGLVLTDGSLVDYEVFERGKTKGISNFRGVMAMNIPDTELKPGKRTSITWRVFSHNGKEDFQRRLLSLGGVIVEADYYVAEQGQTVTLTIKQGKRSRTEKHTITQLGDQRININYGNGKTTWAELRCTESIDKLIRKRAEFIINHQQMMNVGDPRFGAYMIYDNEADTIVGSATRSDLMEGRERLGMGIFLAVLANQDKVTDVKYKNSLELYANFVANLQDPDYTTWSHVARVKRPRGYNYAWVSDYWFRMYELTKEKRFAERGYQTLQALFRRFGLNFYCIDYPITIGLKTLKDVGMTAEADTLLNNFRLIGDGFCKRGLQIPKHEVNYEQSIIAPAVQLLSELYLITGEQKYMDGAHIMMPACDAFNFTQPSCYMHDIAIRHWDGYWFGKRQTYGDTYPHYWSTITANAFYYYSKALEKEALVKNNGILTEGIKQRCEEYMRRATDIVRNNLVSFEEDGRATCAILRPCRVNGDKAMYRDAYANDQDFALMFYLLITK